MDKKKEKMTPERRYELACLILGGVVLGGALGCILRPNEWTFAVIPLLGVCLTALLWCAAARLWLCRDKQRLLAKSFTRPVRFALAVPAWAGATWLLYLLPGNVTGLDDVLAESVIILTLLAGTVFVPAAALGLGVASVLAAVVHLRRTPAAETRAYREGPLALALVLCVGVAALGGVSEVIWCISNGFSFGDELMLVVIPALLAAGGWKAAQAGFALMNRIKRFRLYDAIIGERRVCPVSDIARASGRKPEEVERDLLDMVRRGYFPLGFVDAETACFYADNAAWRAQNPERARQQDAPLGKEQPRPAPAAQEPVPEDEPGGGYLRELERQLARIENADIRAKAALLVDVNTDAVAYAQNIHEQNYPASLTKVMTALLILEKASGNDALLTQEVTAPESAFASPYYAADGSTAGIKAGEVLTVKQLLQCMLIVSANEACNILAE